MQCAASASLEVEATAGGPLGSRQKTSLPGTRARSLPKSTRVACQAATSSPRGAIEMRGGLAGALCVQTQPACPAVRAKGGRSRFRGSAHPPALVTMSIGRLILVRTLKGTISLIWRGGHPAGASLQEGPGIDSVSRDIPKLGFLKQRCQALSAGRRWLRGPSGKETSQRAFFGRAK